ncbi:hypothetical protein ACNR9Q_11145 [Maribacter sp. X9]|uniref:hypothetical protein n=1 Tax=Maribacter sp. X9 TaxID=3402159 RepID=UPI003AF3FF97
MILVLKTSVRKQKEVKRLKPFLDQLSRGRANWNFDLEDCDHILRIESDFLKVSEVVELLNRMNFFCEELEDIVTVKIE